MIAASDLARCDWQEPGGPDAARTIADFLAGIGIATGVEPLEGHSLLQGIDVRQGAIVVDPHCPVWPGDMLHEAGHIAVTDPALRGAAQPVSDDPGEEMASIAWSVAAARACGIGLEVLFHPGGYKGGSASLIEAFTQQRSPFGVPLLAWWGMTENPGPADEPGPAAFPAMKRWLR